ncbi:hypothetical protein [Amycolatopsis sp. BJA-103]|uniref:hypothetical protein n=1 Tax=unclassified Amycolatopsis TaxID=2618356 RepID=UPI000C75BB4E|nr:hypothetical protein [Amycolatopsis sp. BJA-103]AUI59290.1 hypothetical protein BKN51_14405 [Amycolatopsis sp. BJA-103]PNE17266.1 hypothetical protein B1H26_20120 [Amycolatopsis sp. BJA-103]
MNPFLSSLSGKLAERWVATLVLPGALFIAAAVCAVRLGHRSAFDLVSVAGWIVREVPRLPVAAVAVFLLIGATAAAMAAQAVGSVAEAVWTRPWRGPARLLAWGLVALRGRLFDRAAARAGVDPVSAYRPRHPAWIGERFRLLNARIAGQYHGLDLGLVWPRLWLLVPETVRTPVQAAESQFRSATRLVGWGVLYLGLGIHWYPAIVVGIGTAALGWSRARSTTATLTTLIEATVDTHLDTILTALGHTVPAAGFTAELARRINDRLAKGD